MFLIKFLIFVDILIAFLIIVLVLFRRSKSGGGLTTVSTSDDNSNSIFGVHTNLYLNKFLTYLVCIFFIITLVITIFTANYSN